MEEEAKNGSSGRIVKILLLIAVLGGCAAICAWLGVEYYVKKRLDSQLACLAGTIRFIETAVGKGPCPLGSWQFFS